MGSPGCWWIVNRDLAKGKWLGIDMQPGHGVDEVQDIHNLPGEWGNRFSSVLCSEVLEHVARPWIALPKLFEVVRPGGWIVVTTLTSFHIHGFPNDYYRYTPSGLKLLMEDAGFVDVQTENQGEIQTRVSDHAEGEGIRIKLPIHVFGVGRKC